MTQPKVTVMMPVLNTHGPWLNVAIRCITEQTYPNLDLIIGDDGSTKSTTLEIEKQAEEKWPDKVRVVRGSGEPGGSAKGVDACLAHADPDTKYFMRADSDDIYHRSRVQNIVKLFETLPPQVAIVYDNFYYLYYAPRPHIVPYTIWPYDYRRFLDECYIATCSVYRASVYEKIPRTYIYDGYYGKCNRHSEDYWHWLAITDYWDAYWMNQDPAFTWTYRFQANSKYNKDRKGVDYARAFVQYAAKERRGLL